MYIDCSSPGIRDIIVTTVNIRTGVVPGTEYGFDRSHKLFLRIIREVLTDLLFVFCLKLCCQLLKVFCCKLNVLLHAALFLHFINQLFKVLLADLHNNV